MAKCVKCREFLPPGFVENNRCIFCIRESDSIIYEDGNKRVKKSEIVAEYKIFLSTVRDRNEILKGALQGDTSQIPEKLLIGDQ